jgi:hypothetical protein
VGRFGETHSGVIAMPARRCARSLDPRRARSAPHIISAWRCEKRLVFAHIAANAKSNESAAVLKLLEFLSLRGTILTTDALICRATLHGGWSTRG